MANNQVRENKKMEVSTERGWFGGVENLSQSEDGYVFWKGEMVELLDTFTDAEEEKNIAVRLASRCMFLESTGTAVNVGNIYLFGDY
ncbi:MAG: hypothetical protein ACYTXF_33305 [Nostoc sp.]